MFKKTGQFFLILMISVGWVFSGWPQAFNFPPSVQKAEAAVSYVGAGTLGAAASAGADPTAALPASTQANDILIIHAWTRSTSDTTTITDFTEITQVDTGTGSHRWFWKRHDGSEGTATCNRTGTTGDSYCQMFAFRGIVTSGNPWNALGTAAADNGTGDPTSHTAITTGAANSMVVVFAGYEDNDASVGAMTGTDPSAYTEVYNESATGSDGSITMAYALRTAAGSTGSISYNYGTITSRSDDEGSLALSLNPALSTYTEQAYRLFNNADSTDVGSALAAQDTAATLGSTGAAFRLRMLVRVDTADLASSGQDFKLQFAEQSGSCDTSFSGESYADVTGSTVIAYSTANSPADGDNLTANANDPTDGGRTIVNQDYEEANNFTNTVAAVPSGQDGKWDFALKDNGASANTAYCFRAVKSDGTVLDTYTAIPQITTADSSPVYSVSITSSGVIEYGVVELSTASSTVNNGYTQTAQNDGNTTEKLNVKSSNATVGTTWTLASSIGSNIYKHEFSTTTGSVWTTMPDSDTYVTAAPSVAQSGTVNFDFRLTTPSASTDYQQKSITITVQAVAP